MIWNNVHLTEQLTAHICYDFIVSLFLFSNADKTAKFLNNY
jgi:hypothetical protein